MMLPTSRHLWTAFAIVASVTAPGATPTQAQPASLPYCDRLVEDAPEQPDSYRCYWMVGRSHALLPEAAQRLDEMLAVQPDNAWARLYLGAILADLGQSRAEEEYRGAIAAFSDHEAPNGEVWGRISLARLLMSRGGLEEAGAQLQAALERAAGVDPALESNVLVNLGQHRFQEGKYSDALSLLKQAESSLFPDGQTYLQLETLDGLAAVSWALGRDRTAMEYYRRELRLTGEQDPYREAGVRRNIALLASGMIHEGSFDRDEVVQLYRDALGAAQRAGNRLAEVSLLRHLAAELDGPEGIAEGERALAAAQRVGEIESLLWTNILLAEKHIRVYPEEPERAYAYAEKAVSLAREHGEPNGYARAAMVRAHLRWLGGHIEQAERDSRIAMDAVERIRALQPEGEIRTRVFGRFTRRYAILVDRWLAVGGIDEAFRVLERLRARSLLEALDAAGVTAGLRPPAAEFPERGELYARIAAIDAGLRQESMSAAQRNELLADRDRLETRTVELRERIASEYPEVAALEGSARFSTEEVREALAPDQALVCYLLPGAEPIPDYPAFSIRSWVLTIQKSGVRALPLPELLGIDHRVAMFRSLLARRDGSERRGAERLGRDLLESLLDVIQEDVTRLVVIPDGALHDLPLGALTDPSRGEPLAAHFEISVVPSAAAWMRWRSSPRQRSGSSLLALADPTIETATTAGETLPAAPSDDAASRSGAPPAALPYARREVTRMARQLAGDSRVLVGSEATQGALVHAGPAAFRMLHLAAHAVVDDERPERSAILLAPDGPGDDGRLEFGEVVGLDLDGQVVLLSTCRGASGPILGGEGVLGLANAFFQAGARVIVAGLWRVQDRETAALVDAFGSHLARGNSVASALSLARRDRMLDGAPTAAWAGMVVLGDGDLVPFPRPGSSGNQWTIPLLVLLALVVITAAVLLIRRSRSRAAP